MNLTVRQQQTLAEIRRLAPVVGIDPAWSAAVAMTESSLGEKQLSPTGCRGVYQMSMIAMRDLWQTMQLQDDDMIDILCGLLFLRLLLRRHGSIEAATGHFCDPNDRDFYVERVKQYMEVFRDPVQ